MRTLKPFLPFLALFIAFVAKAQEHPWEKYGYQPKEITLSNGKYQEFHDNDTIVLIGSAIFDRKNGRLLGVAEKDTSKNYEVIRPAVISRWICPDPLAEKAYSITPYRYSFNDPINIIDPDGLFEFKWNKDKDGNFSLVLSKSTDKDAPEQNMETFMKETGLSEKEVKKLFGGMEKTEVFFNESNDGIAVSGLKGKFGKKLKQVEKSILEYNKKSLEGANCGGAAISLGTHNKIDRNLLLSLDGIPLKEYNLTMNLKEDYVKTDNTKIGDIRLYFSKEGDRWHAATILLKNHKETQVFYKRNGSSQGLYMLNNEQEMRKADNYDGKIDGNYRKK